MQFAITIKVKFTAHARDRALARGIEERDVARILNHPLATVENKHEGTYHSYGDAIDPYTKKERFIVVVYAKLNNVAKVITVMWTDKGGLRSHGFSNL